MSADINLKSIRNKVLSAGKTRKAALSTAESFVNANKSKFTQDFLQHPVTREISTGPDSLNISNTLKGYGNLFSFIGFSFGSNPIEPITSKINSIRAIRSSLLFKKGTGGGSQGSYEIRVRVPSLKDFASIAPMPWESGRSWLLDIEKTISGLGSYLYEKVKASRSGSAIQTPSSYSNASFRRVKYFSDLYKKFISGLKGGRARKS
jgi:hypothetical protein